MDGKWPKTKTRFDESFYKKGLKMTEERRIKMSLSVTDTANSTVIAEHFEAKKYAYRQSKDGMILSFVLHPNDMPKDIAISNIGTRYMVAVVEIGDDEKPIVPKSKTNGQRCLAKAQLVCREADYQAWIRLNASRWIEPSEEWVLDLPDEELARHVMHKVCKIESRSDLQSDPDAQERLVIHLDEYIGAVT